ncbi:MAG: FKBP-type peptidyl-prolyl cis-trans isomerase [Bacteriovoracaceae bacterium]|nr:FKBP-type peptidyl-prolyl cis-trans isomerase [Bacteriovoracaceae bacterium]
METNQEKVSYLIGRQIGEDFKTQGIALQVDMFTDGLRSAFLGEASKLSNDEAKTVMEGFQQKMQEQAQAAAGALGEVNLKEGAEFLAKNREVEGVVELTSGLQYKVIKEGSGNTPSATSTVETHYEGTLINGTIFDSSYKRGQTATFPVNGVIPGWTEALQLMKEGAVWELCIPSGLAYGANGAGADIGPNATLLFKIELIAVK